MSNGTRWPDEPRLSADFAARVLRRADAIRARRRRGQGAALVAAGALLVTLAVGPRVAPPPTREVPATKAADAASGTDFLSDFGAGWRSSRGDALASRRDEDADALSYLFPDVAPLARFVDEYSAGTDGMEMDDEAVPSDDVTSRGELL